MKKIGFIKNNSFFVFVCSLKNIKEYDMLINFIIGKTLSQDMHVSDF